MKQIAPILWLASLTLLSGCDFFSVSDRVFLDDPGPILFVSDYRGSDQLYSMQPDGSDIRQLTNEFRQFFGMSELAVSDAVWSPDGKSIVLRAAGRTGPSVYQRAAMYIVDSRGRRTDNCPGIRGEDPVWSPNSKEFIYIERRERYFADPVNCQVELFSNGPDVKTSEITDWGNDGQTLLGHADISIYDYGSDILYWHVRAYFWTPDGDSLFSVGVNGERYLSPIWSSSEEDMALAIRRDQDQMLYRMSTDGTDLLQLTGDEYYNVIPVAWSVDDTQILAHGRKRGSHRTYVLMVDANGGGVTDITPFPGDRSIPTSWSAGM